MEPTDPDAPPPPPLRETEDVQVEKPAAKRPKSVVAEDIYAELSYGQVESQGSEVDLEGEDKQEKFVALSSIEPPDGRTEDYAPIDTNLFRPPGEKSVIPGSRAIPVEAFRTCYRKISVSNVNEKRAKYICKLCENSAKPLTLV